MCPSNEQVREVERAMAAHALAAWRSADARTGLADAEALVIHADALTRWSERLRMALRGDLTGDEDWLNSPLDHATRSRAGNHAQVVRTELRRGRSA